MNLILAGEIINMIPNSTILSIPLRQDAEKTIRIGSSRVLLELVIHAFQVGESVEGIVDMYPSLKIADVYAVIAYYLSNPQEIDDYVRQRDEQGEQIQSAIVANYDDATKALLPRLRTIRHNKQSDD